MGFGSRLQSIVLNLIHKERVETDLDAEIRAYVEATTDEKIAAGMAPSEAHRRALAEIGGIEPVKQAVRDYRSGTAIELIWQDVRYGLRQLRRNPAFAWTAVITLALGIGATTAIFSAVYALLLRPLPYQGADRLMFIYQLTKYGDMAALANQDFFAAQSALRSFESVAGFLDYGDENLTSAGA